MSKAKTKPDAPETYRLMRLDISHLMRVSALSIKADGNHVIISGKNGSGKSSVLAGLWTLIRGRSATEFPEPVQHGEDKATVTGDFGAFTVRREFTAESSKLTITAADGNKINKPQEVLNGFLGNLSFDPIAFLGERPVAQVNTILAVVGVTPPVERVEQITGERHEAKPGESASDYLTRLAADDIGVYYVARRQVGREAEQKLHAYQEQSEVLEKLGGPLGKDEQARSASEVLAQIDELSKQAEERRQLVERAREAQQEHEYAETRLAGIVAEKGREETVATSIRNQIDALQRQLSEKIDSIAALSERIKKGKAVVADLSKDAGTAEFAVADFADPTPQIAAARQQLATLETANKSLERRRLADEQAGRLSREYEAAKESHKQYDALLEQLRGLRARLLDGIDLGVPGLEVGDGELRLNGVSFKQASMAEKIRVSCAVAMRQNPKLRVLRLDDAEHLDSESLRSLLAIADELDFQVIMTRVADTEELKVEIVEAV